MFFIAAADKKETKALYLANRTKGRLTINIPTLPAGNYLMEVAKGMVLSMLASAQAF